MKAMDVFDRGASQRSVLPFSREMVKQADS